MSNNNPNTKKILRIIGACIILISVYLSVGGFFKGMQEINKSKNEMLPQTKRIPPEYSNLFKDRIQKELSIATTFNNKNRDGITILEYSDEFDIFIYRISNSFPYSLKQNIHLEKENTDYSPDVTYNFADQMTTLVNLAYASGEKPLVNQLYVVFDINNSTSVINNDSTVDYFINFKKVSIRYKKSSKNDIVISTKEDLLENETLPVELLFLKRKNALFFLLMSPKDEEQQFPTGFLLQCIK